MRHLILVFLVIGSVMIFFSCQEESAFTPELSQSEQIPVSLAKPSPNLTGTLAKPSPNLIGTTDTPFYPLNGPFYWDGTINFEGYGDFDGEYGLIFRSHGPPRDFSQASTFEEDFIIYELKTDWTKPENVYMKGWNAGVVTNANTPPDDPSKFVANGKITEANLSFEGWLGRSVHIRGVVTWISVGWPEKAVGTFRIN